MQKLPVILLFFTLFIGVFAASARALHEREPDAGAPTRKVVAPPGVFDEETPGVSLLADYGAFQLFAVTDDGFRSLAQSETDGAVAADDMDVMTINGRSFDTQRDPLPLITGPEAATQTGFSLHLIQFVGPVKDDWLADVRATGSQPVHYIANNAYLVWTDENGRSQLQAMTRQETFMQFSAPLPAAWKVSRPLAERAEQAAETAVLPVVIQMVRHSRQADTEARLAGLMVSQASGWQPVMQFQTIIGSLRQKDITAVAQMPDVYWIGLQQPRELMDEVQAQIMAGNLITDAYSAVPVGPGYLDWLDSFGFSQNPDDYPLVDITDDGIGNGKAAEAGGDVTFREFGLLANPSRLDAISNCTNAVDGRGSGGHGHLNLSIAGGYDTRTGFPYQDDEGYQLGMGVNPYGRFSGTRVFNDNNNWDTSACGGNDAGLIKHNQDSGAKIINNSWGCASCAGLYDAASQIFDDGVRDADPSEAGNQEMVYIFSAGNSGNAGTISTPGNAKNVISVGASENVRPYGADGCGKGASQADDAMDLAPFSSRGPAPGERVKPDLVAPGSHVQGTAATTADFTGVNICGGTTSAYYPPGQTDFTWSSGTSHSAPAVAGLVSLYYHLLESRYGLSDPSPALLKAYLLAHTTYLTGYGANDTLPSNNQGYGLPDMGAGFDTTPRILLDQSVVFGGSGEQWTQTVYVADPAQPVRVVLAFTDEAGAVGTSPQVNDLDLQVTAGGQVYVGNHMAQQWSTPGGAADRANNVEAVYLSPGVSGVMTVTVTAFNVAGDGVPGNADVTDQDFALVCTNCLDSDFDLTVTPLALAVCSVNEVPFSVHLSAKADFADNVMLSTDGLPVGATAVFAPNPVTPPTLVSGTIGNLTAASPGDYRIEVIGTNTVISRTGGLDLSLFTGLPAASDLLTPLDGVEAQPLDLLLTWGPVEQASSYSIQIAADPLFTNIVDRETGLVVTQYQPQHLVENGHYFWRVRAENICGAGAYSTAFDFDTIVKKFVYLPLINK